MNLSNTLLYLACDYPFLVTFLKHHRISLLSSCAQWTSVLGGRNLYENEGQRQSDNVSNKFIKKNKNNSQIYLRYHHFIILDLCKSSLVLLINCACVCVLVQPGFEHLVLSGTQKKQKKREMEL